MTTASIRGYRLLTACVIGIAVAGCATDQEQFESADFGNSVRHTIALQTASPNSSGLGLDGQKADAVLKAYRADVAKPKSVEQPISIAIYGK